MACAAKLSKAESSAFVRSIDDDYRVHWIVDSLPVGMFTKDALQENNFVRGFPVGFRLGSPDKWKHYIYNHIRIIIQYHDDAESSGPDEDVTTKIVGFRVEPMSIKHSFDGQDFLPGVTILSTCNAMTSPVHDPRNYQSVDKADTVIFSYDVFWEKSTTEWTNRWDIYLNADSPNDKIHWFSITNAIMVVLLLSVLIAIILLRALRKDIAKYNDPAALEEGNDESGWKLVHGDVFRPPTTSPMLFRYFTSLDFNGSLTPCIFNVCIFFLFFFFSLFIC